jgi:Zn-dependent metalloprotease
MTHGRTAFTLLTAALVAGPLLAEERAVAKDQLQSARSRAMELRQNLGLDDRHDFAVRRGHTDEMGQTHTRMNQLFQGVRVWGAELISHTDADGNQRPMTSELRRNIAVSVKPTLNEGEVLGTPT